jgi:tetratricopeptide (TPR) repeat protein
MRVAFRCPFCHETVGGGVACSACLARHHDACWEENGGCGTCGERRRSGTASPWKILVGGAAIVAAGLLGEAVGEARAYAPDRAIAATPRSEYGWRCRALRFRESGEPERAIADLTEALACDPRSSISWSLRGLLRLETDDVPGAVRDLNRAAELDPDDALARRYLRRVNGAK